MKPQNIFEQLVDITQCLEACPELYMYLGTTKVALPNIPQGTEVLACFMPETGICELQQPISGATEDDVQHVKTIGTFALKLTLEPIDENPQ